MFRDLRRFKQAVAPEKCAEILTNAKRGVLSVNGLDGYPYGVPMDFYYDPTDGKIYFHSSKSGHKIDAIKENPHVCLTVWDDGYKPDDDWALYITSVIVMGRAELVTDKDITYEKTRAFAMKYYPSEDEVDEEMKKDIARVQLIALTPDNICGKRVHEK